MLNLLRLAITLIFMLTAMIAGMRFIGLSRPSSEESILQKMFTNPDGSLCEKPCLFGIHPGILQQAADKNRLSQFSWMKNINLRAGDLEGWFGIEGQNAAFFATSSTNAAIYLESNDGFMPGSITFSQPSLGDVLTTFGPPSLANWKGDALQLWYNDETMVVWCYPQTSTISNPIRPETPIDSIQIYPSNDFAISQFQKITWHGFVNIGHYIVSQ